MPTLVVLLLVVLETFSPAPAELTIPLAEYRAKILREDLATRLPRSDAAAAALPISGPIPFQPGDDLTDGRYALRGQLTEDQMVRLIAAYFPERYHTWALAVALCESTWYTFAESPISTAAGLWQFIRTTWNWVAGETGTGTYASGAVFDAYDQARNASWLVQNGGKQHWVCKG